MKTEVKRYFSIAGILFLLYLAIHYWETIQGLLLLALSAAMPLLIGCVIAYPVNVLMSLYERHFFPHSQNKFIRKSRRIVCLIAALLTMICIVTIVIVLIVPEFVECIKILIDMIPDAIESALDHIETWHILPEDIFAVLESIDWKSRIGQIADSLRSGFGSVMDIAIKTVTTVFSTLVTSLLALVFSLYLLIGKERIGTQFGRLLARYLPMRVFDRLMHVTHVLNDCFTRYVVGQCTEAIILGFLCTIGMMLFRFPYATMIGALVAFTALIPVAGAYIGAFVGAFMILTQSPIRAFFFLIFIVVLQQLEGNLIYPRVVGSSIGLPGIWVLAAVTVGGGVMGIFGMLLGVPLAATVYKLLKEDIDRDNRMAAAETAASDIPVITEDAAPAIDILPDPKPMTTSAGTASRTGSKKKKKSKK